jgi:hypothetical protein
MVFVLAEVEVNTIKHVPDLFKKATIRLRNLLIIVPLKRQPALLRHYLQSAHITSPTNFKVLTSNLLIRIRRLLVIDQLLLKPIPRRRRIH